MSSSGQHSPWNALWQQRQAASASEAPLCPCIPEAAAMRGCRRMPHAAAASQGISPEHTTVHRALRGSGEPSAEHPSFSGDGSRETSQAALWRALWHIAACQTVTPNNSLACRKGPSDALYSSCALTICQGPIEGGTCHLNGGLPALYHQKASHAMQVSTCILPWQTAHCT